MDCRRNFFAALAGLFAGLFAAAPAEAQGGARYHPGHRCPRCKRFVTTIWRRGPGPGQHMHRCGQTVWYH
jgi:hypothetical protein